MCHSGLGAEELGEGGRETRSRADTREMQTGGKNKVLAGLRAFLLKHFFSMRTG